MSVSQDAVMVLLLVITLAVLANLLTSIVIAARQFSLAARVHSLETARSDQYTHRDASEVKERLAGIEAKLVVTQDVMRTIQEHLLEQDP